MPPGGDDLHAQLLRPRASSTIPSLSDTDSSALRTRTSPGCGALDPRRRRRSLVARGRLRRHSQSLSRRPARSPMASDRWPPRVLGIGRSAPRANSAHGLGEQLVLERAQRLEHLLAARAHRAARRRPAGSPGPSPRPRRRSARSRRTPSRRRPSACSIARRPGKAGSSDGCTLMTAPRKAREEGRAEQLHVARASTTSRAPALGQPVGQRRVACLAVGVVRAGEHRVGHPRRRGARERRRAGSARGDCHDLGLSPVHGVEQGLQVGAGARDQHRDRKGSATRAR